MKKAIFYKEWIKTRRYFPIALIVSVIFIIYALLGIQRVINFRGVAHLWEILLSRDVVFIETLTYIPLLAGLLLAIVQFVPEMQQKRLKLTLHLPYPQNRMLMLMLIAGLSELTVIYLINYLILYAYLQNILAPELTDRILLTSLPWYIGGITAYSLTRPGNGSFSTFLSVAALYGFFFSRMFLRHMTDLYGSCFFLPVSHSYCLGYLSHALKPENKTDHH